MGEGRQIVVVNAVVVGVTGSEGRLGELVLVRPEGTGQLRKIGLSLPIARQSPPRPANT